MLQEEEEGLIRDDSGLLHEETLQPAATQCGRQLLQRIPLCSAFFVVGACVALPGPTLLDLREQVKVDIGPMTFVFMARSSGYLLGVLLGGFLCRCCNRRILLGCTLLVASLTTLTLPWSATLTILAVIMSAQGVALGIFDTGGNLFCKRMWTRRSSRDVHVLQLAFGLGAFTAALVVALFLSDGAFFTSNANVTQVTVGKWPGQLDVPLENKSHRTLRFSEHDTISDLRIQRDLDSLEKNTSSFQEKANVNGLIGSGISDVSDTVEKFNASPESESNLNNSYTPSVLPGVETTTVAKKPAVAQDESLKTGNEDGSKIKPESVEKDTKTSSVGMATETRSRKENASVTTEPSSVSSLPNTNLSSVGHLNLTTSTVISMLTTASIVVPTIVAPPRNATSNFTTPKSITPGNSFTTAKTVGTHTQNTTSITTTPRSASITTTPKAISNTSTPKLTRSTTATTSSTTATTSSTTATASSTTATTSSTTATTSSTTATTSSTTATTSTSNTHTTVATSNAHASVTANTKSTDQSSDHNTTAVPSEQTTVLAKSVTSISAASSPSGHSTTTALAPTVSSLPPPLVNPHTLSPGNGDSLTDYNVTVSSNVTSNLFNKILDTVESMSKVQSIYLMVGMVLLLNAFMFLMLYCKDKLCSVPLQSADICTERSLNVGGCCKGFVLTSLFLLCFCYFGCEIAVGGLISAFTVDFAHWTKDSGAMVTAVFWGALATGRGCASLAAHRCSPSCMLAIDLTLMNVGCLVLSCGLYFELKLLLVGAFVLGLGMSSVFPAIISLAEIYFPLSGKVTGILLLGSSLGGIVIPVVTGYLFQLRDGMVLMQICLGLSVVSLAVFLVMQCCVSQKSNSFLGHDRTGFLPLDDEDSMEMEETHFDRSRSDLLKKHNKVNRYRETEYKSLVSDLDE